MKSICITTEWAVGAPLLLPTGQVMMTAASEVVLYTPQGSPDPSWAPTIKSYPKTIAVH